MAKNLRIPIAKTGISGIRGGILPSLVVVNAPRVKATPQRKQLTEGISRHGVPKNAFRIRVFKGEVRRGCFLQKTPPPEKHPILKQFFFTIPQQLRYKSSHAGVIFVFQDISVCGAGDCGCAVGVQFDRVDNHDWEVVGAEENAGKKLFLCWAIGRRFSLATAGVWGGVLSLLSLVSGGV